MKIKARQIFQVMIPLLVMIGLIPLVTDDLILTFVYAVIISLMLALKRERGDFVILAFGFVAMIVFETLFIATGVEIFLRTSLFGIMPLWLPFLWAYAFIVMRRTLKIIGY